MLSVESKRPLFEGRTSAVYGMKVTIVHKNQNPKAATLSEPSMKRGRSVWKKRSVKGKCNHGAILRQPCRNYLKVLARDRFVSIGILPNVNSIKTNRDVKLEISVCSRIMRFMNNRTKKAKERVLFPKKKEKATTRMQAIVRIVSQMGCVSQDSQLLDSQEANKPGETRCKKSWYRFGEFGLLSLRYVKQVSEKRKDHRFFKIQVTNLHQRSPYALKLEDRSREETERQQRCARSNAWNLAKNIHKLKERQGYIPLARGRMGPPRCGNKRAGRKRVRG